MAGWNGRPPSAKGNLDKSGRRIVLTAPVNLATGNCIWGERHPSSYQHQVPGTIPDSIGARVTRGVQQHRALRLLADAPHGRTVADMLADGFTDALLDRLARDGLATIQPGTICTSTRRITVIWVEITEAGRRSLADKRLVE